MWDLLNCKNLFSIWCVPILSSLLWCGPNNETSFFKSASLWVVSSLLLYCRRLRTFCWLLSLSYFVVMSLVRRTAFRSIITKIVKLFALILLSNYFFPFIFLFDVRLYKAHDIKGSITFFLKAGKLLLLLVLHHMAFLSPEALKLSTQTTSEWRSTLAHLSQMSYTFKEQLLQPRTRIQLRWNLATQTWRLTVVVGEWFRVQWRVAID